MALKILNTQNIVQKIRNIILKLTVQMESSVLYFLKLHKCLQTLKNL